MYQYLSFVEQARRGALVFANKFDLRPIAPFLVHLEWLAVGWLAAALGGRILLAFHVAGALAGGLLAAAVTRALRVAGLAGRELGWGLALVLCGSGIGWLRALRGAPLEQLPDAFLLIYPTNQRLVGSPHALLGTGLLILGLIELVAWRSGRAGPAKWLAVVTVLGLSRPFDMALLLGSAALLWCLDLVRGLPPSAVLRQAASATWLLPVLFYDTLAYGLHPSFGIYSGSQNTVPRPSAGDWVIALAPAALLALGHFWRAGVSRDFRPLREALVASVVVILLALILPLGFSLQFVTPVGTVLLLLAATAVPPRSLPLTALVLCPSSLWLLSVLSSYPQQALLGPEVRDALATLEQRCAPGDLLLASETMSVLAAGLTPCRVVAGHWVLTPEYRTRMAQVEAFFAHETSPRQRAEALARWQPDLILAGAGAFDGGHAYVSVWRRGSLELWQRVVGGLTP